MSVDPFLLEILVCPETRRPVRLASDDMAKALQAASAKGTLTNRGGQRVDRFEHALVRDDNEVAYPVRNGIPIMLIDEQVSLHQVR